MSGETSCEEENWNSVLVIKTATSSGMFLHNTPKLSAGDGSGTVQDTFHGVEDTFNQNVFQVRTGKFPHHVHVINHWISASSKTFFKALFSLRCHNTLTSPLLNMVVQSWVPL